jgi:hypothetical protein
MALSDSDDDFDMYYDSSDNDSEWRDVEDSALPRLARVARRP